MACHICGKIIKNTFVKDKDYQKVRDHSVLQVNTEYRGAAHSICNLKFNVPSEVSVVFHRMNSRN